MCFIHGLAVGQENDSLSTSKVKKRRAIVFSTQAVLAGGSLIYLNQAWYSQFDQSSFHFFNDNNLWMQMDKLGHVTAVNYLSIINYKAYRWAGYNNKTATWLGFGISYGFLTAVEIMDGFSTGWGFSWGDMAANTIGGALFVAQQLTWKDQRMIMKFSYHPTEYADMRPEVLGETAGQRILKDYNGQTIWLSVNPQSFSKKKRFFPVWLNLSVGYSIDGLLGGASNKGDDYDFSDIPRVRQFFFAPDVDFTRIRTKSKFLKGFFAVINLIKIPAPTLGVDQTGKVQFFWLYF
jgi:hypothetical protein